MELLPHQIQAVRTISSKNTFMLADAPGLGKTLTALSVAASDRHLLSSEISVIAPRNVLPHWRATADTLGRAFKETLFTNYEQVHKHLPRLNACKFLILDESHYLKNVTSKRFKIISRICQRIDLKVLALTGTPVFSYPLDLFGQLYCLRLIRGDEYHAFRLRYCNPKTMKMRGRIWVDYRGCTIANMPELKAKFAPYVLRRDWKDVGLSMPPLTMTDMEVEAEGLTGSPEYLAAANDFGQWYKDTTGKDSTGLEQFTVLRRLLGLAKVPAVLDFLDEEIPSGMKFLIFSEFREPAEILAKAILEKCSSTFLVMGGQSESYRANVFNAFSQSQAPAVMVATTDSLNVGVNLQAATRIYFLDVGFKPASFVQAVHRAWRIGQPSPVSVVRFVVKDSMDEFVTKNVLTKESYMGALGLGNTVSLGSR